jgi:hypothetical protein
MPLEELALKVANRPGQLARVARILAQARINLAAISVDSSGRGGQVRLVVDRPDDAFGLLKSEGFEIERYVLIPVRLADRSGSFLRVLDLLAAAKVNVESVSILVAREGSDCLVALACSNATKARSVLTKAGLLSEAAERLVGNADLMAFTPSIPGESVGLLL